MSSYFISYSQRDGLRFAQRLADELTSGGTPVDVWLDQHSLSPGESWSNAIRSALADCEAVLVVVTRDIGQASTTRNEIQQALRYKKPIVPLLVHPDADLPLALTGLRAVDFSQDFERGVTQLRRHLQWLATPEGRLRELEHRLDAARQDLASTTDGRSQARLRQEVGELEEEVAQYRDMVQHPEQARRQAEERIKRGLAAERAASRPTESPPGEPGAVRARLVNAPPVPSMFVDRVELLDRVRRSLADDGTRLVAIIGPPGMGKTALVSRMLEALRDQLVGDGVPDGVVYLGSHHVRADPVVAVLDGLAAVLPESVAAELSGLTRDPRVPPERRLRALLAAFSAGRYWLILDDLDGWPLAPPSDENLFRTLFESEPANLKIVVTARLLPEWLRLRSRSGPSDELRSFDLGGLDQASALSFLKQFDSDGSLGLSDAPRDDLEQLWRVSEGEPAKLASLLAILRADRRSSLGQVLEEHAGTDDLGAEALAAEAFNRLDETTQQVMEAAAIFDGGVTAAAVDYLLQPYRPGISSGELLDRMVELGMSDKSDERYALKPLQRAHALGRIERGRRSDRHQTDPIPFTKVALLRRAREYLRQAGASAEELLRLEDREAEITQSRMVAGFNPDSIAGDDLLEIQDDVNALCSVLAARGVKPPLSVGLFGDWGAGKSFFMRQMRKRVRLLAERSSGRDSAFCSQVRQITFNAWHYADANLWASLMAHIFERLASNEPKDASEADAQARNRVAAARSALLAKATRARQERQLHFEATEQLAAQREKFENRRVSGVLVLRSVWDEATSKLQDDLGWVERHAGQTELSVEDIKVLASEYQGARNRVAKVLQQVADRRRTRKLVIVAVLGAVGLALGVAWLLVNQSTPGALAVAASAVTWTVGFLRFLRQPIRVVSGIADRTTSILQRVSTAEDQQLEPFRRQQSQAEQRIRELDQDIETMDRQVKELDWNRQLFGYLSERSDSSDYRKHLGIIATIRQDLEQLSVLLRRSRESTDPDLPGIERIILYIDDLDRCPAERVVKVLEAVHLLLAIDLFVVVVGVDARWLLRSLEHHYAALLKRADDGDKRPDAADWASTPMNYLEKIFQIPYTLRPMDPGSYERLVTSLMASQSLVTLEPDHPEDRAEAGEELVLEVGGSRPSSTVAEDAPREAAPERPDGEADQVPPSADEEVDLAPLALLITPQELAFMKRLAPLIGTPRAAKRLSNVYRLLRASMDPADLDGFVGTATGPGEYQVALLLLGILVGCPNQAAVVFERLQEADEQATWPELAEELRKRVAPEDPEASKWERIFAWLDRLHGDPQLTLPDEATPYRRWALAVARYSFQTGHLITSGPARQASTT